LAASSDSLGRSILCAMALMLSGCIILIKSYLVVCATTVLLWVSEAAEALLQCKRTGRLGHLSAEDLCYQALPAW
jgi:hypothetical protein